MQQLRAAFFLITILAASQALAADPPAAPPKYSITTWTSKDGVSGVVSSLTQDRDGYLWIGTNGSLIRFDGARFVRWEGPALAGSGVSTLVTARDGSLWVGFFGNGALSRIHDGDVTNYGVTHGLPEGFINAILEDRDGTIWVGGNGGLSMQRGGTWERVPLNPDPQQPEVRELYEDRTGRLWAATSAGLFRRNRGESVFSRLPSLGTHAIVEDGAGHFWVTTPQQTIARWSEDGATTVPPGPGTPPKVWQLMRDRNGHLWIATPGQGLVRLSVDPGDARVSADMLAATDGLSNDVVRALYEDREGNIWVGTLGGLNRLTQTTVVRDTSCGKALTGRRIDSVAATPDAVWVGTEEGLFKCAARGGRYLASDRIAPAPINALHVDSQGMLWVSTRQGEIARVINDRLVPVIRTTELFRSTALTTDHHGNLWFSDARRGLVGVHDGETQTLEGAARLKGALAAMTDSGGRVWMGFGDGSVAVVEDARIRLFSKDSGLTGEMAGAIHEDRTGVMWVGTNGGLSRFDNGRFATLGANEPRFPVANIRAIADDANGYLWIGTNAGIVRMAPSEFARAVGEPVYQPKYQLYGFSEGVPGAALLGHPAVSRGSDGRLWFVRSDGLTLVDPARARESAPVPVHIEGAIADRKPTAPVPQFTFPPALASLQIDYTGFSLAAPETVRFWYRLDGFDSDWVDAGTRRQAFYTNLPPRSYRFRVTTSRDGVRNDAEAQWEFSIEPHFYQTSLFAALCVLGLAASVWGAWGLRMRQVRARMALVLAERTRLSRELHDTLLQSLIGIGLRCDDIARKMDSTPQTAKEQLTNLRRRVEIYARDARYSIMNLRSPGLESTDISTALRETGERLTEGRGVSFACEVVGTPRRSTPEREEHLIKIGQEAIANAVRHSHASQIRLGVHYDSDAIMLSVTDDGCGLPRADYKTGDHWGLRTMEERAQQLRGKFTLSSQPGSGTEIQVVVPLEA